jgi:hypothetical protein
MVYQNRFDKLSGDIGGQGGAISDRKHMVRNFIIYGNWHWNCRWETKYQYIGAVTHFMHAVRNLDAVFPVCRSVEE